jgi:chromosome segregation ATPase
LQLQEHLTKQILILETTARKLKQSEAVISGLKEQLDEYKTKFQQSEAVISGLKKQLVEYKSKFQQSEAVISGLKNQLEIKEEVLKNNNETQIQLQTDIDGLTMKVESLNQTLQSLCDTPEHVSTYNIAAVTLSKWTEIPPAISRVKLFIV